MVNLWHIIHYQICKGGGEALRFLQFIFKSFGYSALTK